MYVHSISCRNSLLLFSNNPKTSFSQFRAKTKYLKPTQIAFHILDTFFLLSKKSLSLPSHSLPNPCQPFAWIGQSIRNSRAKRVWSDIISFCKIKLLFHSKHLEHFSIHTLLWNGTKGYLARASNISLGPFGQGGSLQTDDQPAEVITPDGIIRAYGHTITFMYSQWLNIKLWKIECHNIKVPPLVYYSTEESFANNIIYTG